MLAELEAEDERIYPLTHNAPVECDVVEQADTALCEAWQGLEQEWRITPPPPQEFCVVKERENQRLK